MDFLNMSVRGKKKKKDFLSMENKDIKLNAKRLFEMNHVMTMEVTLF
jgi:hypothetical protein